MTPANVPLVLMVDDDLGAHERIRALLPPAVQLVSAYSTRQALDRCRQLVADSPGATIVCILDYRLPDLDGAMLAVSLRKLLPTAPLIALSSLPESGPLIGVSGTTLALSKSISDDALREQLLGVLANPAATPPDPVFAPYLAHHAVALASPSARRTSVAVLASSRPILQLLTEHLQAAAIAVTAQSTSAGALATMLPMVRAQAIVCDGPAWRRAGELAAGGGLPLLVVAMALSTAIGLSIEPVNVLVTPEPGALLGAIEQIVAGVTYRDPQIAAAYELLELTPAERPILAYIVRSSSIEETARALNLTDSATRKVRARALARLHASGPDDVRTALDELLIR